MTVNHGVLGSSPSGGAIFIVGPLEKRFNSHAFHACIHGFESRTGHQEIKMSISVRNGFFYVWSTKKTDISKNELSAFYFLCKCMVESNSFGDSTR